MLYLSQIITVLLLIKLGFWLSSTRFTVGVEWSALHEENNWKVTEQEAVNKTQRSKDCGTIKFILTEHIGVRCVSKYAWKRCKRCHKIVYKQSR